jgi:phosphoribosylformylglycinamidine synthase
MSGFRSAVITFPGSNCDRDMASALEKVSGKAPFRVWHGDADLPERLDFIALPGALMRNAGIRFVCREVPLIVENPQSLFTARYGAGQRIAIPVAHHDGNYFADDATLDRLEGEGRVAFRYGEEVNGSVRGIAGVLNEAGNVLGMMPHPERAIESAHGGADGRALFESVVGSLADA